MIPGRDERYHDRDTSSREDVEFSRSTVRSFGFVHLQEIHWDYGLVDERGLLFHVFGVSGISYCQCAMRSIFVVVCYALDTTRFYGRRKHISGKILMEHEAHCFMVSCHEDRQLTDGAPLWSLFNFDCLRFVTFIAGTSFLSPPDFINTSGRYFGWHLLPFTAWQPGPRPPPPPPLRGRGNPCDTKRSITPGSTTMVDGREQQRNTAVYPSEHLLASSTAIRVAIIRGV